MALDTLAPAAVLVSTTYSADPTGGYKVHLAIHMQASLRASSNSYSSLS